MTDYISYRVMAHRILMHVLEWPGDNPPVVFLHNFTGNALLALRLGKLLARRRRLIAPDLRGRGQSDMPFGEYGLPIHLREIIGCLDHLNTGRCVLAGHSFGATLAVFLAAEFPERVSGLILFDGGAVPGQQAMQMLNMYYDNLTYRYASPEAYIARFKNLPLYQPWTEELELLLRSNLREQPDGTYFRSVPRYVVDADRRAEHLSTWQQLPDLYPKLKCPVLVLRAEFGITGVDDQVLTDEAIEPMRAGLKDAEFVTVRGAGHTSLMTIPQAERDAAILRFLERV